MVAQHYRWDFYGLSTDTKPDATNPKVANGSTYYEADTSKLYVWYKDQWYEKQDTGGGGGGTGIRVLTADDYDYPEANPTSINLDNLEVGVYIVDSGTSTSLNVHYGSTSSSVIYKGVLIYGGSGTFTSFPDHNTSYDKPVFTSFLGNVNRSQAIGETDIVNNLISNVGYKPLSAKQGKVLKDLIDGYHPA